MKKKKPEVCRNEIKSYIVRAGMTMSEVVDYLADEYGWSSSVPLVVRITLKPWSPAQSRKYPSRG